MTTKQQLCAVATVLALLLTGCTQSNEPTDAPTRWDISDTLPGATKVNDVVQRVGARGPRACGLRSSLRTLVGDYNYDHAPLEFGEYELDDVNVRYFVAWLDDSVLRPGEKPASWIMKSVNTCASAKPVEGESSYYHYYTITPIGTTNSGRFGWYETTADPQGVPPCDNYTDSNTGRSTPGTCPPPYQGTGMYTLVDGWILVGVDVTTDNTDVDLKQVADVDKLLDELVAEVSADPLTKYDYDHRWDN